MSEDDKDIEEVFQEAAEREKTDEETVDEFLEENYDELEAALDYKRNELGLESPTNKTGEKSEPDLDEDKRKEKESYIKQMRIKDELDNIIGDKHGTQGHEGHAKYAAILAGSLISVGFLYDPWFLTLYLLGLVYGTIEISRRLPGSRGSKFAILVKNHFKPYLMSGITFFMIFIGKMDVPKLEGGLGLLAKILIGI